MWFLYKKQEPHQCHWDIINNQRILIHCFEQGHYVCKCGEKKVKPKDDKGGWRTYQLKNKDESESDTKNFKARRR